MNPDRKDALIQDKIKKLLKNPPQYKFPEARKKELIALIFKLAEKKDRKSSS